MAEAIVSVLLEKSASSIIHQFGLALNAKKDLRKLETTFQTIKCVLEDAESQSMKNKSLLDWLAKLEDATYDMEDLLDYVEGRKLEIHGHMIKKVRCFFSRSNPIIFRFKISHRVKEMRERLDKISADRFKFHLKKREANDRKMEVDGRRETWSKFVEKNIYGRDDDIETIVSFLLQTNNEKENVLILPIIGMGGLGKTTLAKLVYNDERVKRNEQFELRRWVYVSKVFNPKKIMKDILLDTEQSCNQDNLESIGIKLENLLTEKKFLLVLDDVWNENENVWENLKPIFNVGKRGSRIIVTTRSENVASIMRNTTPYNLKELSDEDCWKLFKQRAFKNGKENSNLVQIGREIVKKCGGVPLAANALGSTLRSKEEEEKWVAVRDSDIWKVDTEGDQIIPSLKLSYTYLLPPVKQCFAYCSLFPKGYEFDKEILISQWIAQGFVRPVDGSLPMEIIANTYFNNLLLISFLQKIENDYKNVRYKMHDLIHDLARFVAGDKVLVEKAEKAVAGLAMGCRYVALMGNIASTIVPANNLKKIRALHVFDYYEEFPESILSSAKCLRTLDLSDYGRIKSLPKLSNLRYIRASIRQVEKLPEYICGLRNLQFVYLSDCGSLRTLPESIGSLCNLRNLKLIGCGSELKPFPDSFDNLEHLVSLDLSESEIELLPIKSFGGLQNLQSINLSQCYRLKEFPDSIGDAKNLRSLNMEGCRILGALPESTSNLTHLESLNLGECGELQELPKDLGKMRSLKHLNIRGCNWLRGMPRGMRQMTNLETLPLFVVGKEEDGGFSSIGDLEHLNHIEGKLCIRNVERVRNYTDATKANLKEKRKLHSLVLFWNREEVWGDEIEEGVVECLEPPPSIKKLKIKNYGGRKIPSWLASSASLPNLAKLVLNGMNRIVCLPAVVFPSLTELVFDDNFYLEEWTTAAAEEAATLFPRLKKLKIEWCPKLKARPCILASVEELEILHGRDEEFLSDTSLQSSSRLRTLEMGVTLSTNVQWTGLRHLASSLQELSIRGCSELRCLPESIRHLASLGRLELLDCEKLSEIGEWVGELQSLRFLYIRSCPGLTSLPNGMRHLAFERLIIGDLPGLKEIPEWVGELQSLRFLEISNWPGLTSLPNGMRHLALDVLFINGCPGLKEIPEWVEELQSLRYLIIGDCPGLSEIGEWVGELQSLRSLSIHDCPGLTSLPNGMRHLALDELFISDCPGLKERCERERGEDWHLISHIPNINIW